MFQRNHMALPPGAFEQSTSRANQFLILIFFDEVDVLVWIKTPNNLNIVLSCLLRPPPPPPTKQAPSQLPRFDLLH